MHLVINSYGATLQKENDLFVISSPEGKQQFPPDVIRTISISKAARITSDAILLAIKHQVDVLFVNDQGMPEGRIWSVQYGSISTIRKNQINFLYSVKALHWVKEWLSKKIESQLAMLLALQPDVTELKKHNQFKSAINSLEDYKRKIMAVEAEYISDVSATIRGWEGAAGKKYFNCLSLCMPPFYQFETRDRRPAQDPFNALLNYAYGILYGKVESALIKAGLDPYVGVFHRDEYNRPALAYDFIETFRVWMDYVVLQLCMAEAIPEEAFEKLPEDGAIRLGPLAKRILIQSVNDYLDEVIRIGDKVMGRISHLEAEAFRLAKYFTKEGADGTLG